MLRRLNTLNAVRLTKSGMRAEKPAEVLEFFGIAQGMDVLDMFSIGGYYTEVLSRVVGSEGSVIAHTNQAYAGFVGEEATIRMPTITCRMSKF